MDPIDTDWEQEKARDAVRKTERVALKSSHEWKSAGRIIGHLWTIFVLLPVVLGILYAIVK
jgi:hypothetical protein